MQHRSGRPAVTVRISIDLSTGGMTKCISDVKSEAGRECDCSSEEKRIDETLTKSNYYSSRKRIFTEHDDVSFLKIMILHL